MSELAWDSMYHIYVFVASDEQQKLAILNRGRQTLQINLMQRIIRGPVE